MQKILLCLVHFPCLSKERLHLCLLQYVKMEGFKYLCYLVLEFILCVLCWEKRSKKIIFYIFRQHHTTCCRQHKHINKKLNSYLKKKERKKCKSLCQQNNVKSKSTEKYFEKDFCHELVHEMWQCYSITDATKMQKLGNLVELEEICSDMCVGCAKREDTEHVAESCKVWGCKFLEDIFAIDILLTLGMHNIKYLNWYQ